MSLLKQLLSHYSWDIAYGTYNESILSSGLKGIKINLVKNPYKNKWFADPFILEEGQDSIQFLVEEFDNRIRRGRIARIKVNKSNNTIVECSIILDLPTHLSFPVIYRMNDELYVHPENSASGASYLYRYDRQNDKLVEPKLILSEPVADAIIRQDRDNYVMYATRVPETNGCTLIEYSSNSFFGPYTKTGEDFFDKNTARMAGMFLNINETTIRPAQDCFGGYGKAVIFFNGHSEISRLVTQSYKYAGIHTFNTFEGSFVIDLKKYDFPLLYKLSRIIKK